MIANIHCKLLTAPFYSSICSGANSDNDMIASGFFHCVAVAEDGGVWTWGLGTQVYMCW